AVLVREGFDESPGVNARRVAFHRRWEGIDEIVLREGAVIAAEAGKRVGVAPPAERPLVVQRGGAVAPAVARRSGLEQGVPDRLSGIVAVDKAPGFVAGTVTPEVEVQRAPAPVGRLLVELTVQVEEAG